MSSYSLVYTTIDTSENAKNLARLVVEDSLAACAHIFPQGVAVYRWEGDIQEESEHLVVFKTKSSLKADAMACIKKNHTYEVPAIFCTEISAGDDDYLGWVSLQTR